MNLSVNIIIPSRLLLENQIHIKLKERLVWKLSFNEQLRSQTEFGNERGEVGGGYVFRVLLCGFVATACLNDIL